MRPLVAMHIFKELGEETYQATDMTRTLASPGFDGGTRFLSVLHTKVPPAPAERFHLDLTYLCQRRLK